MLSPQPAAYRDPLEPKNYNYAQITQSAVNFIIDHNSVVSTRNPGCDINEKYEKGATTPRQIERRKLITALALTAILGIGALVLGSLYVKYELVKLVAIPLFIGTSYAAYKLYKLRPDFDHPETRERIISDIADASFFAIAEKYTLNEVVGYALLNSSKVVKAAASRIHELYIKFSHFFRTFKALKDQKQSDINDVMEVYNQQMRPFRRERELARREADDVRKVGDLGAALVHSRQGEKKQRDADGWDVAAAVGRGVAHGVAREKDIQAEAQFRADTAQIEKWKVDCLRKIDIAFHTQIGVLNDCYLKAEKELFSNRAPQQRPVVSPLAAASAPMNEPPAYEEVLTGT